jgi:hypothetical protein
VGIE